jgi:hypothetical protein
MNKNFNEQEFFKYLQYHLTKEALHESGEMWKGRALNFTAAINEVYNKAQQKYAIEKITDNYQQLFILDTLNQIYNQFPYVLKTEKLISYMDTLPGYFKNQPIISKTYELHAYIIMHIERHFYNFMDENNLSIDRKAHCPYKNYHIFNEKEKLEHSLSHIMKNDKNLNNKI